MTHIKKLVLHGFKSFAKPTEIIFDKGLNCIAGANGSGKSNIPDSICFVLGRLSIKSMRASRASKLIFHGGKEGKPAHFAKVSLVFDNSNNDFPIAMPEIEISRIVKRNGNSIYKINNETKTRQEVLELLSQANIDPEGFNIIMQGQIDSIIRMPPDEKRQIIEEIAGISIYEIRKEKSLHELEKTESQLKEVKTILNERRAYLNNLEKEREQALKHENLKNDIKKCKASILAKKTQEVKKEISKLVLEISNKEKQTGKLRQNIEEIKGKIQANNSRISEIEEEIEKKTGIEQENLRSKILELKTDVARSNMKKDSIKEQLESLERRESNSLQEIENLKTEIKEIEAKSNIKISGSEKARFLETNKHIDELKRKIDDIDLRKERYQLHKIEITRKQAMLEDKERQLILLKEKIKSLEQEIDSKPIKKIDENVKSKREEHQKILEASHLKLKEIEREITRLVTRKEIEKKDVEEILKLSQCPKCKQAITPDYKNNLVSRIKEIIQGIEKDLEEKSKGKKEIENEIEKISSIIENFLEKQQELEKFFLLEKEISLKRQELEKLRNSMVEVEAEISNMNNEINSIKKEMPNYQDLTIKYSEYSAKLEKLKEELISIKLKKPIEHIERDLNLEAELKRRNIEQAEKNIKQAKKDILELNIRLKENINEFEAKSNELKNKEQEQQVIEKKFKKFFEEKQKLQQETHKFDIEINEKQMNKNLVESEINEIKVNKAGIDASLSTLDIELKEFEGIELIQQSLNELERRLEKYEHEFSEMGPVNLRALEVYDKIKVEYDEINTRVLKLEEEKQEILKIIQEIDKKKKKSFMQTLNSINDTFSNNYNLLSKKGTAFLELENEEDPFSGGLNILIKLAKGKYQDSDLLSGGEKVIVALALIFAIQKYKPYGFYIFDEIDAALDKVNSEILAKLIKDNIKNSQYLMISHNDALISNADILYGTSMQDGITRIFSLKV
jgi:chromosome segregation protein